MRMRVCARNVQRPYSPSHRGLRWLAVFGAAWIVCMSDGNAVAEEAFGLHGNDAAKSASAWPRIKRTISIIEGLTSPVSPEELAEKLDLNRSAFNKSRKERSLGTAPGLHGVKLSVDNIWYTDVPDSSESISVSLSIATFKNPKYGEKIVKEHIIFDISVIEAGGSCIAFSSIKSEAKELGWGGRDLNYNTGVDGVSMPDFDVVYLNKSNIIVYIHLQKKTECISLVQGVTTKDLEAYDAQ